MESCDGQGNGRQGGVFQSTKASPDPASRLVAGFPTAMAYKLDPLLHPRLTHGWSAVQGPSNNLKRGKQQ